MIKNGFTVTWFLFFSSENINKCAIPWKTTSSAWWEATGALHIALWEDLLIVGNSSSCAPPPRVMFPHEPSIRPNTLQWCPTAVWGALTIKHLSVCPSVWWFWFSNLLSADFSSGTPWSSAPTTIIQVRQFREITGAANCEITCVYRNYSHCFLGLPESVILEYTDI